jgi:hypothetical protein
MGTALRIWEVLKSAGARVLCRHREIYSLLQVFEHEWLAERWTVSERLGDRFRGVTCRENDGPVSQCNDFGNRRNYPASHVDIENGKIEFGAPRHR